MINNREIQEHEKTQQPFDEHITIPKSELEDDRCENCECACWGYDDCSHTVFTISDDCPVISDLISFIKRHDLPKNHEIFRRVVVERKSALMSTTGKTGCKLCKKAHPLNRQW